MSDESIQVDPDALDQFAAGVAGPMATIGGDRGGEGSALADDYSPNGPANQVLQEFMGAAELIDPFSGGGPGGLQEGYAFAQVHQAYAGALGQFLGEVGRGLTTLGMAAAAIRVEYAYGDADSAAVTDSVYQMFAPSLEATARNDRDQRQHTWDEFLADNAKRGSVGSMLIYLAGGGPADVQRGRNILALQAAVEAQQHAQYGGEFERQVQEARERLEEGGGVTEEEGRVGSGDLGRGSAPTSVLNLDVNGTPIRDGDGRITGWLPYDNERVASAPPQFMTGDLPSPGA
jgi:hypothetical protein